MCAVTFRFRSLSLSSFHFLLLSISFFLWKHFHCDILRPLRERKRKEEEGIYRGVIGMATV